jgi:hypothetical protein
MGHVALMVGELCVQVGKETPGDGVDALCITRASRSSSSAATSASMAVQRSARPLRMRFVAEVASLGTVAFHARAIRATAKAREDRSERLRHSRNMQLVAACVRLVLHSHAATAEADTDVRQRSPE